MFSVHHIFPIPTPVFLEHAPHVPPELRPRAAALRGTDLHQLTGLGDVSSKGNGWLRTGSK
jgi:hypothetical protein